MKTTTTIVCGIIALGAVAAVTIGGAQAQRNTATPVAQMKAATAPKPGDCKQGYEMATAANPALAQHIWQAAVAKKHGNNWSLWAGAQNKSIIPEGASGGGVQFRALARPCFFFPVP